MHYPVTLSPLTEFLFIEHYERLTKLSISILKLIPFEASLKRTFIRFIMKTYL